METPLTSTRFFKMRIIIYLVGLLIILGSIGMAYLNVSNWFVVTIIGFLTMGVGEGYTKGR